MATLQSKLSISAGSALLFALINLPETYKLTDSLLPLNLFDKSKNCPTYLGLLVHTVVFGLITFLSMGSSMSETERMMKLKNSVYASLVFFLVSSPIMYALTSKLFGRTIASSAGCPTTTGVVVHAAVYGLLLVGLMYLP